LDSVISKIAIIVPVYNAEKEAPDSVGAILGQKRFFDNLEVVVVDDGSTDSTASSLKKLPVTYLYQSNRGPAAARNAGWIHVKAEIYFFTDSDCIPQDDWVLRMLRAFDPKVDVVAGSYGLKEHSNLLERCIHQELMYRHRHMPQYVNVFGSFNVAIRSEALKSIGGFNESYKNASAEDVDLAYRLTKAGYRIRFQKDAKVIHNHSEHLPGYLRNQFYHGFWRVKLYGEHPDFLSGDNYTKIKDISEPFLALIALGLAAFCGNLFVYTTFLFIIAILLVMQIATDFAMCGNFGIIAALFFSFVTFCRAFARALGMIAGVIKFKPCYAFFKRK